jgi:cysteine desulfurase
MKKRIYLDNNGSTVLDPRVLQVVINDLESHYGNPSSAHSFGQESRNRLTKARSTIANILHVKPNEVIFTSGGTESLNMVLRGYLEKNKGHVVTSSVEHSSVYSTLKALENTGCAVTYLSPGLWGAVTVDAVREALRPDTRLITLMSVNNETGVKTDIEGVAALAQERSIPFFLDGIAQLGKEPLVIPSGVSAICFSGHKIHAPKGIGLAIVRSNVKFPSICTGGFQEYGRRGGTENMSGIVGLAEAIRLLPLELPAASQRMAFLRDRLEQGILSKISGVNVNGQGPRIANTTNLSFADIEGEMLATSLDMEGVAVSHGSACASGALEPSRILLNMGISPALARSSLRFSLSRFTTEGEIDDCIEIVTRIIMRMRGPR